jgi:threonine dehydrogenase-like Zn-dependent dehydrogenase
MRGAVIHAPGDVRCEHRDDPRIEHSTDAIIRVSVTCVCGSDLWEYRGLDPIPEPRPTGHEYVGVVEEVGSDVTAIKPGQTVVGSFAFSDNTCALCRAGFHTNCTHSDFSWARGAQAEYMRVPLADGTLVATHETPDAELLPSLLAASDVLGTGWFGAVAADVRPGKTVAVVGDGAVGLLAVLAAAELGAEQIIAFSRHEPRQKLATDFGATNIVAERGDEGAERVKELTNGLGADSVIEAVGTEEARLQAACTARPGGHIGHVGVPHGADLPIREMFFARRLHLHGGSAPVRRFLPDLIARITDGAIDPGKVFDLVLPLDQVAEGYRAMDERAAIKTLLLP